ncbi:unnamed protein product [Amaranthus hypochondriacus]
MYPLKKIQHDTTRPMRGKPRLQSMLQSPTIVAKSQEFVRTSQVPQNTPEHALPLEFVPTSYVLENSTPSTLRPINAPQSKITSNSSTASLPIHNLSDAPSTPRVCSPPQDFLPDNINDRNGSSFESDGNGSSKYGSSFESMGNLQASKPRHQILIKDWPATVPFDEMKNVATIGIAYGTIQPHVVSNETNIRYVVKFNSSNQPIGKGGDVLTSFLGDIAMRDAFCPIDLKNWHKLRNSSKVDILDIVRKHFVIPEGKVFDSIIMKRIGNVWRKHRHILKETHFNKKLSKEDNYAKYPAGVKKLSWEALVDYWSSPDFQKYSTIGKQDCEALGHVHRSGPTSFANQRVQ